MIKVRKQYTIGREIEDVFAFLSNPEHDPIWQRAVRDVHLTSPKPIKEGATYEITFNFLGRRMHFFAENTAFVPPHYFAYRSIDGPFGYTGQVRLSPVPEGTGVEVEIEIETKGFFGIVPESLLSKTFNRQLDADTETLKHHLETPHPVEA